MANFKPFKNYMFYCLDQIIARFEIKPPFLDAGCGRGDLAEYLARKDWHGKAIDFSPKAIEHTQTLLASFPEVRIEQKSLLEETGTFASIFLWDVIEHIKDDIPVLRSLNQAIIPGGHLLISVPSNPREWRWDDDFYGHYRRYTREEMQQKLEQTGWTPLLFWDVSYPIFWAMRRVYTHVKIKSSAQDDKTYQTQISSTVNAWDFPLISSILNNDNFLWRILYRWQFNRYKKKLHKGSQWMVLAVKKEES